MFLRTVMCQETMDIPPKPHCVRRIVYPRLGLRLLRVVSVDRDATDAGQWQRSGSRVVNSAIKKYLHKEKKRKLTQSAEIIEDFVESENEDGGAAASRLPPPGAMAPANTTQYLMERVYEDLQQSLTFPSEEQLESPESRYDACLLFQQRDFDRHYGALWR